MTSAPKNKLPPHHKALQGKADVQRKLCRDWLLYIMSSSFEKPRTKDDLCADAMDCFKVSKKAFDYAWTSAIEQTGNRYWYESLSRSRKKTAKSKTQIR
jgi:hypothetical protein